MVQREAKIGSKVGLHARPAATFTEAVAQLPFEVTIAPAGAPEEEALDASSILSLMSLGAAYGDVVVLRAQGADGVAEALDQLASLLETDLDA